MIGLRSHLEEDWMCCSISTCQHNLLCRLISYSLSILLKTCRYGCRQSYALTRTRDKQTVAGTTTGTSISARKRERERESNNCVRQISKRAHTLPAGMSSKPEKSVTLNFRNIRPWPHKRVRPCLTVFDRGQRTRSLHLPLVVVGVRAR